MLNKIILFVVVVFFSGTALHAQTTIDNSTLPDVGDVIEYRSFANFEDTSDFKATGENLQWTYKYFRYGPNSEDEFTDIKTTELADTFPEANMLLNLAGFTVAADRTDDEINIVGAVLNGFGGFEFNINSNFDEEFKYRVTPFEYGQSFSDQFDVVISFPSDLIPGLDTIQLPLPGVVLDSIRITTISMKEEIADAYGTLNLLGNNFDVLKVKQTDSVQTVLELGISSILGFSWINGSLFLGDALNNFNRKVTTYKFLANGSKASLIEFVDNSFVDSLGVPISDISGRLSVDIVSDVADLDLNTQMIDVYPNPTSDFIRFDKISKKGSFTSDIRIYDALGKLILHQSNVDISQQFDVSTLNQGIYFIKINEKDVSYTGQFYKS